MVLSWTHTSVTNTAIKLHLIELAAPNEPPAPAYRIVDRIVSYSSAVAVIFVVLSYVGISLPFSNQIDP